MLEQFSQVFGAMFGIGENGKCFSSTRRARSASYSTKNHVFLLSLEFSPCFNDNFVISCHLNICPIFILFIYLFICIKFFHVSRTFLSFL